MVARTDVSSLWLNCFYANHSVDRRTIRKLGHKSNYGFDLSDDKRRVHSHSGKVATRGRTELRRSQFCSVGIFAGLAIHYQIKVISASDILGLWI